MGVPLSAVISPLVYAVAIVVVDLVNLATPVSDPLKNYGGTSSNAALTPEQVVAVVLGLLLPGAVVLLFSWLGLRRLLRRGITGAPVLALGARDPKPGHAEEQQLANVVAEMAIAAGIPPPAFKLLDSPAANAGVVGSSLSDATIVVTTGLLDALDRDETQAVVGQLVGSTGNGDLRIGITLMSLFVSFGGVSSFLGAPFDKRSRGVVRRLLGLAFRRRRKRDPSAEGALITDLLSDQPYGATDSPPPKTGLLSVLTLPFLMASGAFSMNRLIFGPFLVDPFLKRRWRARRYLADASAVELTRNPTALARALKKLESHGALVPGTEWASHLFIVGGEPAERSDIADLHAPILLRIERLIRMGAEAEPGKAHPRRGAGFWIFLVVTSPLWLGFVFLMYGIGLALTAISFAIDGLFLAPVVAGLHALLRAAGR